MDVQTHTAETLNEPLGSRRRSWSMQRWLVLAVAAVLGLAASVGSYTRAQQLDPIIYSYWGFGDSEANGPKTIDLLFDSDIPLVTTIMTDRFSNVHWRSSEHPLMSLTMHPPVEVLTKLGLPTITAVQATVALVCGLWTALFFLLLLGIGCRLLDAAVLMVLANVSAAGLFWFALPETFLFGSLTIVMALAVLAFPLGLHPLVRHTAAIALSHSLVVTNVFVGLIAAVRSLSLKNVWIVGTSAWFVASMLWTVQKMLYPWTEYFFPPRNTMPKYTHGVSVERIVEVAQSVFSHTVVMPAIDLVETASQRQMSVQHAVVGSGGWLGAMATLAWLALLGMGVWAAVRFRVELVVVCALTLLAQFAFCVVFGTETFLFALTALPLSIVVVAGATMTRLRPYALGLAAVVIVFAGWNNWAQFQDAAQVTRDVAAWAASWSPPPSP